MRETFRLCFDAESFPNFHSYIFKNIYTQEVHEFMIFANYQDDSKSVNQLADLLYFLDHRCDWLIGYNSLDYDNLLIAHLSTHRKRLLKTHPKKITKEINELSSSIIAAQYSRQGSFELYSLKKKEMSFRSLDLIQQYNTIDRVSLKQLAIGMRWPILEDLPFPTNHIVLAEQIPKIMYYNLNDVNITEELMKLLTEGINLRISYTNKLKTDIINSCESDIGKRVMANYYEQASGVPYDTFKKLRTEYTQLELKNCVSPMIRFETKEYQRILDMIKEAKIDPNKKSENVKKKKQFELMLRSKYLTHTIALGGIHSNNPPEIMKEDDRYMYIDLDVASFYPWIIINDKLYPKHLGPVFTDVYRKYIVEERMRIRKDDPILSHILKIAANATYGLTKSKYSWLYDPLITTYICISGQLYLLMLMEALEMYSNCMIVYSNTDGLTVRVPRNEVNLFYSICNKWQLYTKFQLEFVQYKKMVIRDVNNFLIFTNDPKKEVKAKGAYVFEKLIHKGYNYPIIAKAVHDYFKFNTPVEETIMQETSIYEFLKAEKTSIYKFDVLLYPLSNPYSPIHLQKNNRWIVSHDNPNEGKLYKVSKETDERTEMEKDWYVTPLNNIDESLPIAEYKINYQYYINQALSLVNLTFETKRETHHQAYSQLVLL